MAFTWNGNKVKEDIEIKVGTVLVQTAITVQSELSVALSTSFPPASKVGEFPHGRTWNLRSSVLYEPTDPREVGRQGRVRVGYATKAFYGAILERFKGRLGLKDIVQRIRGKLAALGLVSKLPP